MKLEEATRILAKELAERGHINIVKKNHAKALSGSYHYPILDSNGAIETYTLGPSLTGSRTRARVVRFTREAGANYLFATKPAATLRGANTSEVLMPYAVFGKQEKQIASEFYTASKDVEDALEKFKLDKRVKLYRKYCSFDKKILDGTKPGPQELFDHMTVKVGDVFELKGGNFLLGGKYVKVTSVSRYSDRSVFVRGQWYSDAALTKKQQKRYIYGRGNTYLSKDLYTFGTIPLPEYLFVFDIPKKDQNSVGNQVIAQSFQSHNAKFVDTLLNEYKRPENTRDFLKYFTVAHKSNQDAVRKKISEMPRHEQNTCINDQIYVPDGPALELNYIGLYLHKPKRFIEYVNSASADHREEVLRAILNPTIMTDFTIDPEAESYIAEKLRSHHGKLLDKIGRGGV